jgi:adenylate cyclase
LKILAVDDNQINLEMLGDIISAGGWEVIPALDGPSALHIARSEFPDLIVLDVSMPGMNGYEVCAALKANPATYSIPVIMLTALNEIDDRVKGLVAGADDYLAKPYSARELIARIETRLRAKSENDHLRATQEVLRATFERYVAPSVVERLLQHPDQVQLGGKLQDVTVIFADLENFTTISEHMDPEELLTMLNQYHELIVKLVQDQGGTIDKFIGDGVMALFNTPIEQRHHQTLAVRAALAIQAALPHFHQRFAAYQRLKINMGIHTGPAVVGNVGAPQIMNFTAVGDTINIAARLQGWSKGGQILISQAVKNTLDETEFAFEPMGAMQLRGRSQAVVTYTLSGLREVQAGA